MRVPVPLVRAAARERDALVAVCSSCGDGKAVRRALKAELKARGLGKRVRIVKVSCLDVCPKNAVAVAVSDRRATTGARYLVVAATDAGRDALVAEIDVSGA